MVLSISRAERMNGICLIWSRGRLISPSLPFGDDRYLNLSVTHGEIVWFNLEKMVTELSVRTTIITAYSSLFEKTENSNESQTLLHRQHCLFVS